MNSCCLLIVRYIVGIFLLILTYRFSFFLSPGKYKYGDDVYKASAAPSGASLSKCRSDAVKALKVGEPVCTHMKCTFGGVWNGGGGDGQKNLFVASFFFDRAAEVILNYSLFHT